MEPGKEVSATVENAADNITPAGVEVHAADEHNKEETHHVNRDEFNTLHHTVSEHTGLLQHISETLDKVAESATEETGTVTDTTPRGTPWTHWGSRKGGI